MCCTNRNNQHLDNYFGEFVMSIEAMKQAEKQEPVECMCGICTLGKREWVGLTDDEILLLAAQVIRQQCVSEMTNQDWIAFARAVESRTLTNQKAKWYQEGVEAEREACAELCEWARPTKQDFDERYWHGCTDCANAIRSRGER